MASNSVASFLTKLLRPEKKDKTRQRQEVKRRHSAPIPDWFDVSDVTGASQKQQKVQSKQNNQQKDKQNKKQKSENETVKRRKNQNGKKSNARDKRHSTALAHWFCMSGNVDTLERTPMPFQDSTNTNGRNKNATSGNTYKNEAVQSVVKRNGDGKSKRKTKNRHSAPIPGWISVRNNKASDDVSDSDHGQGVNSRERVRELSPTVRYRVEGTLERPYVFPSGLTFGPEGRKLKLRSSSEGRKRSKKHRRPNERTVSVDVHRSSQENITKEYTYEEADSRSDLDKSDFDVRRAFYLKYDSNMSTHSEERNLYRHSMAALPESFDFSSEIDESFYSFGNYKSYTSDSTEHHDREFHDRENYTRDRNGDKRRTYGESRQSRSRNRYSMPPKNDDFVYMGSFENLHAMTHHQKQPKSSVEHPERGSVRRRKHKKERNKNRYSLPPKNSDLVYMGSMEKLHQVITENRQIDHIPLQVDIVAASADARSPESPCYQEYADDSINPYDNNFENCKSPTSSQLDLSMSSTEMQGSNQRGTLRREDHCNSLPELSFQGHLSVARSTRSDGQTDADFEEEDDDFFDVSSPVVRPSKLSSANPFSRNLGRSSCMPGNKRFIPPPPCVDAPHAITEDNPVSNQNHEAAGGTSGRLFNFPPPPCYTPPKEEMVKVQAHISSMNTCHKGSQADLSVQLNDLEIDMEDRDMSLKRAEAKTIFAAISTSSDKNMELASVGDDANADQPRSNTIVGIKRDWDREYHSHLADTSQGSDDVFEDSTQTAEVKAAGLPHDGAGDTLCDKTETKKPVTSKTAAPYSTTMTAAETRIPAATQDRTKSTEDLNSNSNDCTNDSTDKTVVTSTPRVVRRVQKSKNTRPTSQIQGERPVPTPRKRYSEIYLPSKEVPNSQQSPSVSKSPTSKAPPVPKRRNLNKSQSLSISSNKATQNDSSRASSCVNVKKQAQFVTANTANELHNSEHSMDDANIYEEIDPSAVSDNHECKKAVSICEQTSSAPQLPQPRLPSSALQTAQRTSAASNRLPRARPCSSIDQFSQSSYPNFGKGATTDPVKKQTRFQLDKHIYDELKDTTNDDDDDSSSADDELSLSNDESSLDKIKRRSMRRCVSVDDLLRSGSILDRSMIMARKRRQRIRERQCKNQQSSSTNRHSNKKRSNSSVNQRQKHSHTDSGHDSDFISPCTSPDAKRLLDNTTFQNGDTPFDDVDDLCEQRQGTLTKKPWEIRLRSMQALRRSRSRENMFASTSRLETISNSRFETLV